MEVFTVFGGCDALDEWYAAQETEEQARRENPVTPSEDVLNAFTWAVHERGWGAEDELNYMSQVQIRYYIFGTVGVISYISVHTICMRG